MPSEPSTWTGMTLTPRNRPRRCRCCCRSRPRRSRPSRCRGRSDRWCRHPRRRQCRRRGSGRRATGDTGVEDGDRRARAGVDRAEDCPSRSVAMTTGSGTAGRVWWRWRSRAKDPVSPRRHPNSLQAPAHRSSPAGGEGERVHVERRDGVARRAVGSCDVVLLLGVGDATLEGDDVRDRRGGAGGARGDVGKCVPDEGALAVVGRGRRRWKLSVSVPVVPTTENVSPNAPEAISPNAKTTARPIPIRRDRPVPECSLNPLCAVPRLVPHNFAPLVSDRPSLTQHAEAGQSRPALGSSSK